MISLATHAAPHVVWTSVFAMLVIGIICGAVGGYIGARTALKVMDMREGVADDDAPR